MIHRRSLVLSMTATSVFGALPLRAQSAFPSRPITFVVPTTPAGQADLMARYLSEQIGRELGQPIIIDNKAGASGIIGLQHAARQPADGHTIVYGVAAWMALNPGFFPNLAYDALKDFDTVTQLGIAPQCLMLGAHVPAKTLDEFIRLAKASPGKYTYASFGNGSTSHLQAELLKQAAGLDMTHIPFRGSAQALQEVIAGRVDFFIIDFSAAGAFIKEGRIRPLAMTGSQRYPDYPDVPTFQELGLPLTLVGWNGVFVPSGTPRNVVAILNQKINAVVQSPAGRVRLRELGLLATGTTPEEFRRIQREDIARWRDVIVKSGAKPD